MSALEDEILNAWERALVAEMKLSPQVARAVVAQLTMASAPNTERIAEIIKQATSEWSLA